MPLSPFVFVSCSVDEASMNIRQHVLDWGKWEEVGEVWGGPLLYSKSRGQHLALMPDEHIFHEDPDVELASALPSPPGILIYLSKHRSESGAKSLTVHPLGNYGENKFGGRARTLVPSAPHEMTAALRALKVEAVKADLPYDVTFEVTHHGPHISTPTFFIEIGSGEAEWADRKAGKAIASALQRMAPDPEERILVGVGGGHYAPRFADVVFKKKACFGHMVPAYALEGLDGRGVKKAIESAVSATPGCSGFYLHKKGIRGEAKQLARGAMEEIGLPIFSSSDIPDVQS